ncbi:MAG: hypothetical protein JWQ81_7018 [Amycolatopsis sp.]|uniref:nuclear transport factor 2 family protein n=1 Tax=Amycolatopsis sp. TaxID=37632 RepID=UPI002609D2CA|nr:nuclear transport factor 2 family protein [Amycolatopsis sp.]MCU1686279.1 hypothetical protein [Amycolatopsis sp.]
MAAAQQTDTANQAGRRRLPAIAIAWEAAWASSDTQRLATLFTTTGARYTDHAFDRTNTGRDGIAGWSSSTKYFVHNASLKVTNAFAGGDQVEISWTFSGQLRDAPTLFSVPAVAVLHLCGNKILTDDDFYNMKDVLAQSGLPAETVFN